ncbi:MAG: thiamine phosphate synthase [Desulfobacterales bacterium]|nr:thiamine phosphate synthase [Desulfobacterales bacterium]
MNRNDAFHGVYLVTGDCPRHPLEKVVAEAANAGLCCVQLREKTADTRTFLDRALRLKALLAPLNIPFIINDRVDIALAAGADGVHIGQSDMPYEKARQLMGPDAVIGLSVETWEDVTAAEALDLAYIGISPVFATPTKTDTKTPWGLDGVARIKAYSRHTLVAIGGLNPDNVPEVVRAGADAAAVVSAICSAEDPKQATTRLNQSFKAGLFRPVF